MAVLCLVVVLPVWPGVFTIDSQAMLRTARADEISNWYAPVLQWVWGVGDRAGLPVATALVASTVGLIVATLACFRLGLGRAPACVATTLLVLWPPVYGMAGWVGRDVWFAAFTLTAVAAMGWSIRRPTHRWALLGLAFAAAWGAAAARQNGFPVLVAVGGLAGWAWARRVRAEVSWPRVVAAGLAALVVGLGTHGVAERLVTSRTEYPAEILYWQDLIAMSLRRNEFVFPADLRRADLTTIRKAWIEGQVGSIVLRPDPLVDYAPYTAGHGDEVRSAWARAIRAHPLDYVVVRTGLATRTWGLRSGSLSAWFDRSDALDRESRELRQRFDGLAGSRAAYLDTFDRDRGNPGLLHLPWLYLLAGGVGAALLIGAGGAARVFGGTALALQVMMQGVIVVAVPVAEFRYEYFQVLLGVIVLVLGVGAWVDRRAGRPVWPDDGSPPDRATGNPPVDAA